MIFESYPWKRFLGKQAEVLCRRKSQRKWTESSLACVERELFVSAYAVRKLLEANKLGVLGTPYLIQFHERIWLRLSPDTAQFGTASFEESEISKVSPQFTR